MPASEIVNDYFKTFSAWILGARGDKNRSVPQILCARQLAITLAHSSAFRAASPSAVGDLLKTHLYKSIVVFAWLVGVLTTSQAQEAVRMSLASADAAAA